jgi:serine protease
MAQVLHGADLNRVVESLRSDPSVEYAFADTREHLQATPTDPVYTSNQYYLKAASTAAGSGTVSSLNAPTAWDITTGSTRIVVGLIDGGVRFDHPDLAGQLLAGYDFVSPDCSTVPGTALYATNCTTANQYSTANDGDGRDADATDPGSGVTAAERASNPYLSSCDAGGETSDWHGTHVAGIVGAKTNNGIGVAGLNWNISLLPVRVIGRCGGYQSDIVDGMRWAVGIAVPGVPNNANPARVLNVSLGSTGSCSGSLYQQAVADVLAKGAIVVAAAGNEDAGVIRPANCSGVISVGAVRPDGMRATYSNSGAGLTIMAPGGDSTASGSGIGLIASTNNAGTLGPVAYTSSGYYAQGAGTSFSTPMVTGVVALMLAVNSALTAQNVQDILTQTARPFVTVSGYLSCVPGGGGNTNNTTPCNCSTSACGAGYLDAGAAVTRVQAQLAPVVTTPVVPTASSSGGGGGGGSLDWLSVAVLLGLALALALNKRPQQPLS